MNEGVRSRLEGPRTRGNSQVHGAWKVQQVPVIAQRPDAHDKALDRPADVGPGRMRVVVRGWALSSR
jgi:hypothetical protein